LPSSSARRCRCDPIGWRELLRTVEVGCGEKSTAATAAAAALPRPPCGGMVEAKCSKRAQPCGGRVGSRVSVGVGWDVGSYASFDLNEFKRWDRHIVRVCLHAPQRHAHCSVSPRARISSGSDVYLGASRAHRAAWVGGAVGSEQ